jgi:hypothetical protein
MLNTNSNILFKCKKKIAAILLAAFLIVPGLTLASTTSTATNISQLRGSNLSINVDSPYGGTPFAFPDGKSAISAHLTALDQTGTFLQNEPLVVSKSPYISINGPMTTSDGAIDWYITSTRAVKARIIVRLKNYPRTMASFNVSFVPDYKITDLTDRNAFTFDRTAFFEAKLDPGIASGIVEAKLIYTYERRYNSWGMWTSRREAKSVNMTSNGDGYFNAKISTDNTSTKRNPTGYFRYTFRFKDASGHMFQRTYTGRLRLPAPDSYYN